MDNRSDHADDVKAMAQWISDGTVSLEYIERVLGDPTCIVVVGSRGDHRGAKSDADADGRD